MTRDAHAHALCFYACQSPISDPGRHAGLFEGLPTDVAGLVRTVQGLLVHVFWAERYGLHLTPERQNEVGLRRVEAQLDRLLELDPSPLTVARPLERRLVGNCRDHSVLLAALLRHQGVPARARCGFGRYFSPGRYEDHWVGEYWNAEEERWVLVDAQLDATQREVLHIPFDPMDVPRDQFIVGGQAWLDCREGRSDPQRYGIQDMHGMWFICGNVVRDLLALNKVELLPWDVWGAMAGNDQEALGAEAERLDALARLGVDAGQQFEAIRAAYEEELARFGLPQQIGSGAGAE